MKTSILTFAFVAVIGVIIGLFYVVNVNDGGSQTQTFIGIYEYASIPVVTDPPISLAVSCVRVEDETVGYINYYLVIKGEFISTWAYAWPPNGFVASLHDEVKVTGVVTKQYDLLGTCYYTVEVASLIPYMQPW